MQERLATHISEIPDTEAEILSAQSHAWAILQIRVRNRETAASLIWRLSAVFRLEEGVWKVHQLHGS